MAMPTRVFDLHTHLFNARYLPLAGVIAAAMNKEHSRLADGVARLLQSLAGSSYPSHAAGLMASDVSDDQRLEMIWRITERELIASMGAAALQGVDRAALAALPRSSPQARRLEVSELHSIIEELDAIDYAQEGWAGDGPANGAPQDLAAAKSLTVGGFLGWARNVVKKALKAVTALMDPEAWGHAENYLEFFLTMLKSEKDMVAKLFDGYGPDLPPLQVAHFMMDMQMAYKPPAPPYYPFEEQLHRMQELQRDHEGRIFGFAAFDPRREDWCKRALAALGKGFLGFKFYPAMGYTPSGHGEAEAARRIADFFDFCVRKDVPVFTHCTPLGFQTLKKEGGNAHPKLWAAVLADPRWHQLRLCFGHAGGGKATNGPLHSMGWDARTEDEWNAPDNFARIVAELCTTYPNAYCEMGNITSMLEAGGADVIVANIERARRDATNAGRPYDFLDKLAYGTDWHMPDLVDNTRRYLDAFVDVMNRPAYLPRLEDFFWKNAYRYLGLPA